VVPDELTAGRHQTGWCGAQASTKRWLGRSGIIRLRLVSPRSASPNHDGVSELKGRGYVPQRLYRLARQGKTVPRQARDIFVQRMDLLDQRATQITLSITCSKGTYIRTLGEDIGLALGCGAHVLHLQRCRVGRFALQDACSLSILQQQVRAGTVSHSLIPVTEALSFLPSLMLTPQQYDDLCIRPGSALATILDTLQPVTQHAAGYRLCIPSQKTVAVVQHQLSPTKISKWKLYVPP